MPNPKLEFFQFKLKHTSGESRTFRDFMLQTGKATTRQSDKTIFYSLYRYFMERPKTNFEQNNSLKKVVTLIVNVGRKKVNKHFDKRPQPKEKHIISGVLNGGGFGNDRILSDLNKKEASSNIRPNQPVLQYYYIFVYLPLEHDTGFMMVHSDSEESITQAMRAYISALFNIGDFRKPLFTSFVPKVFRDEYKNGATITSLTFLNNDIGANIPDDHPLKSFISELDVRITLTPKGHDADLSMLEQFKSFFGLRRFGTDAYNRSLDEFEHCKVSTKNKDTSTTKVFDWNDRDQELQPVVYLKNRVELEPDGSPNFVSLDTFCMDLFQNHILQEIRPDLNVERVD